jgi:flavin reductase (DIM6/NTAB) family NADH-FMN oxidoreductase RutF
MFYDPRSEPHGLAHNPFTSLVMPRPIGWISSLSKEGVANLAPYSFCNLVGGQPPFVMFSSYGVKDSQKNIEETGEFVVNMAVGALKEAVVASSEPVAADVDEFEMTGLKKAPSINIAAPRVAESPISLECTLNSIIPLVAKSGQKGDSTIILGEIVGVHISDEVIVDEMIDISRVQPLTRLGYLDYAVIDSVFQMPR